MAYTVAMVYLGADHRGYALKEALKVLLQRHDVALHDVGAAALVPGDDYVDYARTVAEMVAKNPEVDRGVVVCGSGVGVAVAASKIDGVRAGLLFSVPQAAAATADDHLNVAALAADFIDEAAALAIVETFLQTSWNHAARHERRVDKITAEE